MSGLKLATGEGVVVCDGAKALILHNAGDEIFRNLQILSVREHQAPATRETGVDRPGRVQTPVGTGRSSVERTNLHDLEEQNFLTALTKDLNQAAELGQLAAITIVAAPGALGVMRSAYSKNLSRALKHEIAKDYVSMPVHEIEKLLTG